MTLNPKKVEWIPSSAQFAAGKLQDGGGGGGPLSHPALAGGGAALCSRSSSDSERTGSVPAQEGQGSAGPWSRSWVPTGKEAAFEREPGFSTLPGHGPPSLPSRLKPWTVFLLPSRKELDISPSDSLSGQEGEIQHGQLQEEAPG